MLTPMLNKRPRRMCPAPGCLRRRTHGWDVNGIWFCSYFCLKSYVKWWANIQKLNREQLTGLKRELKRGEF